MTKKFLIGIAAAFLVGSTLFAGAQSFINMFVGVCDPASASHCIKPNSDGSINTGTAALPTGAATAALQSSVGATAHTDATALLVPVPIPNVGAVTVTAATIGATSAQALAAGSRKYLFIQNVSASASIACRADGGTAALNTAGSFMLPPLAARTWEGSATPNAAITCIASIASTPATIEAL